MKIKFTNLHFANAEQAVVEANKILAANNLPFITYGSFGGGGGGVSMKPVKPDTLKWGVPCHELKRGKEYVHNKLGRCKFIAVHPDDGACLIMEETDREDGEICHFFICEEYNLREIS